jgi:hypothetical protein
MSVTRATPRNTTGLTVQPLASTLSQALVRVAAPSTGEHVALGDARRYEARWVSQQLDSDGLGVDVALDAQRPRRFSGQVSSISLGALVPIDELLSPGEHWLFVAPVSASGLISRPAPGAPPAASAVRFLIGDAAPGTAADLGAVWLRKPEGTYNGEKSGRVLFDATVFDAAGAALTVPCTLRLTGEINGELAAPGPFSVLALPGGDYAISASAPGTRAASARFNVNPELGGPN